MINKDMKIIVASGALLTFALSMICLFFEPVCALICVLLGLSVTGIFIYYTKKRYDALNELNNYLSLICSGKYDLDIADNSEGEVSILKNNIYKVMILLRTKNELLERDNTYLSDSLADISHQLKTPLTSMMVMTDLLKEEKKADKQQEFISIIETQLDKMKWLITNLLKMSKLDADTVDFKKEEFSCREALEQSVKPFLITLDLKGIDLTMDIGDFDIVGDSGWTVEALENIIKNCIEHTDKNGELKITTKENFIYNSIMISDNGCGIAKEDLPHIFERFYHGKNSSSDSVGIGLALAKIIFEKENAQISVTSEENEGTEFEIKFYKSII